MRWHTITPIFIKNIAFPTILFENSPVFLVQFVFYQQGERRKGGGKGGRERER
jgi:hypothetical protein